MGMMIIRHKVKDYGQWRPVFDRHAEMQRAVDLSNPRVYHSADSNRSEIVVIFDTEDTKTAKDFAASTDLKEAMASLGYWTHQQSISLNRSIDLPHALETKVLDAAVAHRSIVVVRANS
jgi:hypothetical protein